MLIYLIFTNYFSSINSTVTTYGRKIMTFIVIIATIKVINPFTSHNYDYGCY